MKLPKELPIKLIYVLLVIFIWTYIFEKSNDTKEDFDMKQMKDVKDMLMNKMGNYLGKNKEDFEAFNKEEEKQSLKPWCSIHGAPFN